MTRWTTTTTTQWNSHTGPDMVLALSTTDEVANTQQGDTVRWEQEMIRWNTRAVTAFCQRSFHFCGRWATRRAPGKEQGTTCKGLLNSPLYWKASKNEDTSVHTYFVQATLMQYTHDHTLNDVASWRKTTNKPLDLAVRARSRAGSSRLGGVRVSSRASLGRERHS